MDGMKGPANSLHTPIPDTHPQIQNLNQKIASMQDELDLMKAENG